MILCLHFRNDIDSLKLWRQNQPRAQFPRKSKKSKQTMAMNSSIMPQHNFLRGQIGTYVYMKIWSYSQFVCFFFSIWVFFHEHSRITELRGKGEGISLTPHYPFHPLHRHLDTSRAITPDSTWLAAGLEPGTFGFLAQVANH